MGGVVGGGRNLPPYIIIYFGIEVYTHNNIYDYTTGLAVHKFCFPPVYRLMKLPLCAAVHHNHCTPVNPAKSRTSERVYTSMRIYI